MYHHFNVTFFLLSTIQLLEIIDWGGGGVCLRKRVFSSCLQDVLGERGAVKNISMLTKVKYNIFKYSSVFT